MTLRLYTPDEVAEIVQARLERLRSTWNREHEDLLAEIGALQDQVDELEAELGHYRRESIGMGTPLRSGE